jgi:NitT/TauT family transport system substrate-binding protein
MTMFASRRMLLVIAVGVVGQFGIFGIGQAQDKAKPAALLKFNYGAPTANYFALYVAKDLGLFQQHGLDPQFYWFQSGAPLLAGLKSESLDVITTGLATVFALGQNIPLKLLFWELDHASSEGLVVHPKSGIESYRDIGKANAIGAPSGTCAQIALALLARKAGVEFKRLNVINIAPPLYANAFLRRSLDAGIAWSPYAQALEESGYRIVNYDPDYTPENGICPGLTGARPKFLKAHPEVGLKLVQIRAKAMEAISKNPQLAIDALVKYLSISPAVAKAAYERECCSRMPSLEQQLDPNSPYSMTSKDGGLAKKLYIASQMLHEAGSIPAPLSWQAIQEAIDPSYLRRFVEGGKR